MGGFTSELLFGMNGNSKFNANKPYSYTPSQAETKLKRPNTDFDTTTSNWTGQATTNSATSGQPQVGMPNQYINTVGQWDNTKIDPNSQKDTNGKGKGA